MTPTPKNTKSIEMRQEIEKLLWKAYDPDKSPNMEEVTDEIMAIFRTYTEGIRDVIAAGKFPNGTPAEWEAGINQGLDQSIRIIEERLV